MTVWASGCGDSDETDTGVATAPYLQALFPTGDRQPAILTIDSPQRAVVALTQGAGAMAADAVPEVLTLTLVSPTGVETEVEAKRHSEQIPDHYYPVEFTPDRPGRWELRGALEEELRLEFSVIPTAEATLVQVGEPLRSVNTPTTDNARGVTPICTRTPEPCPFHAVNLADAIGAGNPIALVISTPGFCQTGICGPTLEILTGVAADFPALTVVHAEVYTDPQQLDTLAPDQLLTDTVKTYGMTFEPGIVVADASGTVTKRLDIIMDAIEIRAALSAVA